MSTASSKKLTTAEADSRRDRRQESRARRTQKRQATRDWLEERRIQASKARRDRAAQKEADRKEKASAEKARPKKGGADYRHTVGKHGTPITYGRGVRATKVHTRPPRRRELAEHAIGLLDESQMAVFIATRNKTVTGRGVPLTTREETALAWQIMSGERTPARV